ncbi:copper oxidase [Rhodococcus sp. AD45-ID]|uniref:multicopper oxidase family protein n=1 Tax=Rhodococcus sp. (strain AD45) TaxID=103808 RepID=UPI0005D375F8|nr:MULTISPECIES: multicopper oxidase domain-containing protein [unclassified Rhodococcus (in: high G+C Gram-positive bacteria)]KJF19744.1 Phenoxazinone synthase [Rhodococcus sp. AD45]PSR40917.1 copper oxidase [Rhodococcus sp. AD45-ID]
MIARYRRSLVALIVVSLTVALAACATGDPVSGAGANYGSDGAPADFREPIKLSSVDGVLEVRLSAHQGSVPLDTASGTVSDFLLFGYDVIRGAASDGSSSGTDVYPAPTLRVNPGERLIVHYDNDLQDLTIEDFYDPAFTPAGGEVPIYPPVLTSAPLNLHTHGVHVSPDGNADNVLLNIPAGQGNVYDYAIPGTMPNGLYWYHSHRHTLTAQQTYMGLAGLLEIGRPDGNLPIVTANDVPVRDMALQYNFIFDRKGLGRKLNDAMWPQFVSTLDPPTGQELADGSYRPSLAPVNFSETTEGSQYFTNWYSGPLSPANHRGQNQFVPANLQSFVGESTNVPADLSLPDNQRDVQYTVNGQFQPSLKLKPGQTEIWVLANISDFAYMPVTLTETATGHHPRFAIVGQDGNPFSEVRPPVDGDGTRLVIPPASRYAIAVTMPESGDLVLEMPPLDGAQPVSNPGILYTNNGTDNPPAELGTVTVDPSVISYADGFFTFPTQQLIRATPDEGEGRTTPFEFGKKLDAYTSFVDTAAANPDVTRNLTVSGGFGNNKASNSDPKAFTYEFADNTFPNIPLIQPRLNSVEEWTITNLNNDEHPMHIHVNDFQVMEVVDPVAGTTTGVQQWGIDNVNVPAPVTDENENALVPASVTLRTKFTEYTGTFVIHCHRLNHEDNGLMATVNVIPEVSTYAVAVPGSPGVPATVQIFDANGDTMLTTVTPFPSFEGTPSVAMADVNGDMVLDLIAGTGAGGAPEVVAYNAVDGPPFTDELARFAPFDAGFRGGVNVAGVDIDGNALADNIIVASGPGMESQVKIYSTVLPTDKKSAPVEFGSFIPYPGSSSGVTIATGMVDAHSGRASIVTAPGPGDEPLVKTFRYDLYEPTAAAGKTDEHAGHTGGPVATSQFLAFDQSYRGGVSLSTGWVAGAEGGAKSIVAGMNGGDGTVRIFSSGSRLDGSPEMYLESPDHHSTDVAFREIASFGPFEGPSGVSVATTSTTTGADLLISGSSGASAEVRKFSLGRADPSATTLTPSLIGTLPPYASGIGALPLGGR